MDSEPANSKDYSPPGQTYDEAPGELYDVFAIGREGARGPYNDRWGTWVSAFVPLTGPVTGGVQTVFGMDIAAADWKWAFVLRAATPAALVAVATILGLLAIFFQRSRRDIRAQQEASLSRALEVNNAGGWDINLLDHTAHRTLIHDRIFGYETLLPSWTYEMFLEHVLPEDRPYVDRRFREAIATQSDWSFECRICRTDGEVRWIMATGGHEQNAEGKSVRMSGLVQNITERNLAEEALHNSEVRFKNLYQDSPIPTFTWQKKGMIG